MPATSNLFIIAHVVDAGGGHGWSSEPLVVAALAVAAAAYAAGVRRLWRSAGAVQGISRAQVWSFAAGWLAVAAALVSPIDRISADLFSMHMVQHELLMIVAAPLLVVGAPLLAFLWALPPHVRRATMGAVRKPALMAGWGVVTAPAVIWLLHAVALWMWHVPALYQAALEHESLHALEHACFFVTASLFWWGLTRGRYGRLGYGAAVIYVFATAMHSGLLGAALTLSPRVWYPIHSASTAAWGLSPIEDQQLAGLIMWVPAGAIFAGMGLYFFAAWVNESGRHTRFNADTTPRTPRTHTAQRALVAIACLVLSESACGRDVEREAAAMTGGDTSRGRAIVAKYGCDTCHVIPGVRTANGRVGPPLVGVATRIYLAGHVPNTPGNMADWIRYPHRHDAQTVMPETGVTEQDARDLAAFMYTLR